jgi:hemoglobin
MFDANQRRKTMSEAAEKSLYARLGGYDAIAAATDDLLGRLTSDPQLGIYWRGHSKDSMKRDRQLVVDFLGAALGGPVIYRGRDMKTSHEGLGISESDWQVFVKHTGATLDKFGVQGKEREEFLAAAASLKGEIVERP